MKFLVGLLASTLLFMIWGTVVAQTTDSVSKHQQESFCVVSGGFKTTVVSRRVIEDPIVPCSWFMDLDENGKAHTVAYLCGGLILEGACKVEQ